MGLDIVEIVLRTEEVFAISIPDEEASNILTVGDLHNAVCRKLGLPATGTAPALGINRTHSNPLVPVVWTSEDVWATIVGIFCDQMLFERDEVIFHARIHDDLGID